MFTITKQFKSFASSTRKGLRKIKVPNRADVVSDRWAGVQHGELADLTVERLGAAGVKIIKEEWAVSADGGDLVGVLTTEDPKNSKGKSLLPKGVQPCFGLLHSNLGRTALRVLAGGRVMVCSNGMVSASGEQVVSRKHTTGIHADGHLAALMDQGVETWLNKLAELVPFTYNMQHTPMNEAGAAEHLITAGREGLVPWNTIGKVEKEFREPQHTAFKARTAWSMYNAWTECMKDRPLQNQREIFAALPGMLVADAA